MKILRNHKIVRTLSFSGIIDEFTQWERSVSWYAQFTLFSLRIIDTVSCVKLEINIAAMYRATLQVTSLIIKYIYLLLDVMSNKS